MTSGFGPRGVVDYAGTQLPTSAELWVKTPHTRDGDKESRDEELCAT